MTMPVDRFAMMLEMQLDLQKNHMKDKNPQLLTDDPMADFMRWNAWACTSELVEAMNEVGWKPWASNRSIAEDSFLKEMVDAFHFFMNMLLCALPDTPEVIADKFTRAYIEKNRINAQRQMDGYDGISSKCPYCKRELTEVEPDHLSLCKGKG
jgi:dimeric dUTPase (all-alpha-NTP-PPase superfamily)